MATPIVTPRVSEIRTILDRQHDGASSLLAVMEDIQEHYRYLPREALIMVSERLPVPLSQVYSVATFYNAFSLQPQGRHRCQVCTGTACHVRGAMQVLDRLETKLGITAGETSEDLEYTLDTVNCLGACALGPIVVADSAYEGLMTSAKVDKLLKRIRREDAEREALQ
ncbi:MAG: NAD(P)H-dependent oxidoreductase subunit E [Acidobacteriota bacterium]|jgi:NADH-quinone oxidoreductase subunit E